MLTRFTPLMLLIGCAIEEEDFPAVYADTVCDRIEECDKGAYENLYDDAEECQDQWADGAEFWMDAADLLGGDYDPEAARECINAIKDADCGDFETGDYECDLY